MLWENVHVATRKGGAPGTRAILRAASLLATLVALLAACSTDLAVPELPDDLVASMMVGVAATGDGPVEELDGLTVSGVVHIVVDVKSKKIKEIRFHHNDSPTPMLVDTSAPFELELDTTTLADGPHTITALAPSGRRGTREVARASFVVHNGPADEGERDGGGGDGGDPGETVAPPPAPLPAPAPGPAPAPRPEPSPSPAISGVRIEVGADPVAVVRAHPAGTTFVFARGVHRLTRPISPRTGDTFVGEDGAILNGSRLLTSFTREGGLWVASHQTQQGWRHGECRAAAPRCSFPEELFIDDVRLRHVDARSKVTAGTFFFDYGADKIYFANDPSGRRVETSIASAAISGDANDVTVRNLVFEKFANAAQRGVIMADRYAATLTFGARWHIVGNTVRLNHGLGIRAGGGARIVDNRVLHNGQLGIASVGPGATLIQGNEIAFNNAVGFSDGWEAGGTKFVKTDGLIVRNNHVHRNDGPGLWTDIDNINTLYEYNLVEGNAGTGIFHEISYRATIRYNTVRNNGLEAGTRRYQYVFGAGILVYTSSDVEVYGNVVEGNWNGIVGLQHARGSGRYGPYELRNLRVRDNTVAMQFHPDGVGPQGERGVIGVSGVAQAGGFDVVFSDAYNNRFDGNRYVVPDTGARHFTWENAIRTFTAWRGYRQDLAGTMVAGSGSSSTLVVR